MAVTPVRTGPLPISSLPSPEISVVWPTSTPLTSVIALFGPGVPSNGTPRSRARGLDCATTVAARKAIARKLAKKRTQRDIGPPAKQAVYRMSAGYALCCLVRPEPDCAGVQSLEDELPWGLRWKSGRKRQCWHRWGPG